MVDEFDQGERGRRARGDDVHRVAGVELLASLGPAARFLQPARIAEDAPHEQSRRAPARLDDAIAQFDRELRWLLVAVACAELERLRAVPLALPGARSSAPRTRSMRCRCEGRRQKIAADSSRSRAH